MQIVSKPFLLAIMMKIFKAIFTAIYEWKLFKAIY